MAESTTSTSLSALEPLDDRGSSVRFETQCVVIPDLEHRSRRPRVVTKSYTLPLWKKRSSSACTSASTPSEDGSSEEHQSHLVLRVPLPTHHSMVRSVDHAPLPPCLVHRAPPSGPSCASAASESPTRHTRAPRKPSPSPSRSDIVTVPLRPCCAACQPVTEAAVVGGNAWLEHFSRAASRRRSTSADGGFRTNTIGGNAVSASYGTLRTRISVDEIDKRRRSSDTGPSTFSHALLSDDAKPEGGCSVPSVLRRTAAPTLSTTDVRPPPSPTCLAPATPRIPEEEDGDDENENELFPLPSPKRTPTTSPAQSPAGSLSSLTVTQPNQSSTISPTLTTSSGDFAGLTLSKPHFLAPPPCSSSSSLSLPKLSGSTTDLTLAEDPPRAPSPSLLSALPTLFGHHHSRSSSPRISFVPPTLIDGLPSGIDCTLPELPESAAVPSPVAILPSPSASQPSISPHHSPTHVRFSWRSRRSISADVISPVPCSTSPTCPPSASPTLTTSSDAKKSSSTSNPRHIIADVLRGIGAIGASGVGPGM